MVGGHGTKNGVECSNFQWIMPGNGYVMLAFNKRG